MGAPPPDFRYVGLEPGPPARGLLLLAPGAGACVVGAALSGVEPSAMLASAVLGAGATLLLARRRGPVLPGLTQRCRMAIVPWGVRVEAEPAVRVLRWAAVRSVSVEFVHETDRDTPSTRWSMVTIETERERFGGRAAGGVALERLEAHFESYAEEAGRPAALDLEGTRALADPLDPEFEQLLDEARRLIRSGELVERFSLAPQSYRDAGARRATPQAASALDSVLTSPVSSMADPRPLAAALVGELGVAVLYGRVAALTTSPHPLLAAVARAAALKLGGDVKRVGALDELADFLPMSDIEQIGRWVRAPSR